MTAAKQVTAVAAVAPKETTFQPVPAAVQTVPPGDPAPGTLDPHTGPVARLMSLLQRPAALPRLRTNAADTRVTAVVMVPDLGTQDTFLPDLGFPDRMP